MSAKLASWRPPATRSNRERGLPLADANTLVAESRVLEQTPLPGPRLANQRPGEARAPMPAHGDGGRMFGGAYWFGREPARAAILELVALPRSVEKSKSRRYHAASVRGPSLFSLLVSPGKAAGEICRGLRSAPMLDPRA